MTTKHPRGAKPSPRHVLAGAVPHVVDPSIAVPPAFLRWPKRMAPWGNYTYGDCVTAEECFAKATAYPQTYISNTEAITWARAHGYLDGAVISDVLTTMRSHGFPLNGKVYEDGPHRSVNWEDPSILSSAIYSHGPVKIGVAADALERLGVTGGKSGWCLHGYPYDLQLDHCTSLCGYGDTLAELCMLFEGHGITVRVPPGQPTGRSYAMFTWCSIGVIDEASLFAMCGEAWIRYPVTIVSA